MINKEYYTEISNKILSGNILSKDQSIEILTNPQIELISLLDAAFEVRRTYFQKKVTIHIINNGQNGHCPEDCSYCAQAKTSKADIAQYAIKSDEEFIAEAKNAYEKGAFRYCMVFAGRGPTTKRTEHLAQLIRKIKAKYPLEICVSAGLLDQDKAKILKEAGLDRLNHNLNTSEKHYSKICTTHTYQDRIDTLLSAKNAGIKLCSGIIVGMQETIEDIVDTAMTLSKMKVASIPVNFLIPIKGNTLEKDPQLTPEFCLKVLCLFRFLNPKAEIRIAAGREKHLRQMQSLALYPANSLFLDGYLNTRGNSRANTLQMIQDGGFTIVSQYSIEELLANEKKLSAAFEKSSEQSMKTIDDLRPLQHSQAL